MYNVQDVIDWLLSHEEMTPKKLQKMLYYCYVWVLTLCNDSADNLENRLFNDEFQAWVHGPVLYDVYLEYRSNGFNPISQEINTETVPFSEDVTDILNQVWDIYGRFNANQLESLTHQEDPWINARKGLSPLERTNAIISDEDIFNYYIQRVN